MADVSVIIPCHNAGAYVGQALESVLTQTDVPREVLVIDDGSTDNTADEVKLYAHRTRGDADGQVRLIEIKDKGGVSHARNVAIDQAKGEYIAFLDADDLWLPEKTARQMELFRRDPRAAGTHCRVFNFRDRINDLEREETEQSKDDPSLEELIRHHWVTTSAAIVSREALGGLRFDETTGHAEDMILFADIRMAGSWRMVDAPLLAKRIHPTQATGSAWHRVWSAETRIKWCRSRAEKIGKQQAADLESELAKGVIGFLEDRYWRRELKDLDAMRQHVATLCPDAMGKSWLHGQRLYPRWVYRLRDLVSPAKP